MSEIGFYFHVPFCSSICHYCDFNRYLVKQEWLEQYPELILAELEFMQEYSFHFLSNHPRPTLYFGGGSPSTLTPEAWEKIFTHLYKRFPQGFKEISIEANPDQVTSELAKCWSHFQVNRISMGAQTFQEEQLKFLGREHQSTQVQKSIGLLSKYHFSLSIDLMFGIPHQTMDTWQEDLKIAMGLPIHHLSFYGLTVEPGTHFDQLKKQNQLPNKSEDIYDDLYLWGVDYLESKGFLRYEVSNFALPHHSCLHNQNYWNHTPYLGFGPGAHSYLPQSRFANPKSWKDYTQYVHSKKEASRYTLPNVQTLNPHDLQFEKIWLGLRQSSGIPLASLENFSQVLLKRAEPLLQEKYLEIKGESPHLCLKARGWLYLDEITHRLVHDGKTADT